MSGLSMGTCTPNFKPVALTVFDLLAFNVQKSVTWPWQGPFSKKIYGPFSDYPWEPARQIWIGEIVDYSLIDRSVRTAGRLEGRTRIHIEAKQYLHHSLGSLGANYYLRSTIYNNNIGLTVMLSLS